MAPVKDPPAPERAQKITAKQAVAWVGALVAVGKASAAWERAKEKADEMLAKYEHLLPPSTDPADKGKRVRQARAGGYQIRATRFKGADYFSLKDFKADGGKVTPLMDKHITPGDERVRVTFKRLDGPVKPGAVEPAGDRW